MNTVRLDRARSPAKAEAEIREDERRRLARELHDGPAQALAGALFGVDLALSALDRAPEAARDELRGARGLVRDALDDVRALMAGLRPRQLEERGLVVALHMLAAMPPLWGAEVGVETRGIGEGDRLPPDVELGLYRIAQEAVSNARRHGAASRVQVSLDVRPTLAELTIADDGRGWEGDSLQSAEGRGEGLPGMRERARLLGGELRVESALGRGTRVTVAAPLGGSDGESEEGRP
jgi:two-component system, NarL family, sensor histidine kinase DegS